METTDDPRTYQHSGEGSPIGAIIALLVGLVAAAVGGTVYSLGIFYIPFVYINFALTIGLAFAVGWMVYRGAILGKVRHGGIAAVIGFIAAVFALYISWVTWMFWASEQQFLTFHPGEVFDIMKSIARKGSWSMFGITPSGAMLYLIWTIEAAIIVGGATLFGGGLLADYPFCEKCKEWASRKMTIGPIDTEGVEEALNALADDNIDPFCELNAASSNARMWVEVTIKACPQCDDLNVLSLELKSLKADAKKGGETEDKTILEKFLVTDAERTKLEKLAEKIAAGPPQPSVRAGSARVNPAQFRQAPDDED